MTYHIDAIFDEAYMLQLLNLQEQPVVYQHSTIKSVLRVDSDYISKLNNIYSTTLKKQGTCFVAGDNFCKQLSLLYSNK
jgi:hypothetical protein